VSRNDHSCFYEIASFRGHISSEDIGTTDHYDCRCRFDSQIDSAILCILRDVFQFSKKYLIGCVANLILNVDLFATLIGQLVHRFLRRMFANARRSMIEATPNDRGSMIVTAAFSSTILHAEIHCRRPSFIVRNDA
jgi:hypothetical protein